jgi:L-threonylcarbamoyladenylate synthase
MMCLSIEQACERLQNGDVVAVPTETVYGLAGLISNQEALKKIFAVKERPFFDPLIVHVKDLESARPLVTSIPKIYQDLAEAFWPGPLTLVTPKSNLVSDLITSGLPTVALRSPNHKIAQAILAKVGPFAAPSANRFGKTSPTTAEHVTQEFGDQVGVVDGGPCDVGVESTVVRLNGETLEILRPGRVLRSDLEKIANRHHVKVAVATSQASPGHLPHHYQPEVPLILLNQELAESELRTRICDALKREDFSIQRLILPRDSREAARVLYSDLRRFSEDSSNVIVVPHSEWHWREESTDLVDRLTRASSFIF